MLRKLLVAFAAILLLPALLFAQDGKLRGTVTDRESGEPLIGANVVVEGTSLGAATDVNGEFVILSVPPGVYAVKVTYIGYSPVTISNIRVSSNITTTQDFQLASSAVQVQAVEIVAERPLIQRNTTNTIRIAQQEEVQYIPFRGVQNIVALSAGTVQQGGQLYVRGGRAGEVAYYVDGANVTNPASMGEAVSLIREAIEEIQLQSGGYTAEFGGANSGIIRSSMRTGGPTWRLSLDYLTDDFAKPGKTFLGTTARGYRNAVATISGPLANGIRVFLANQYNYSRNDQAIFLEPFRFEGLKTDNFGSRRMGLPLPGLEVTSAGDTVRGIVEFKKNYLFDNWSWSNTAQGNLVFDMTQLADLPLKIRLSGNYTFSRSIGTGSWPGALANYYLKDAKRGLSDGNNLFGNFRLTHFLSQTTFYELGVSYMRNWGTGYDPDFKDDWAKYPDSVANAELGYTGVGGYGWVNRYTGPPTLSTIYMWNFQDPDRPNNSYSKYKQTNIGMTIDLTSQVTSRWELKAGGALDSWVYRSYSIGNIGAYLRWIDPDMNGTPNPDAEVYASDLKKGIALEQARRARIIAVAGVTNYGYDFMGNETDGYSLPGKPTVYDKPYKPVFASAYVQNKVEYSDLVLNFGVRYEYRYTDIREIGKTLNPLTGEYDYQTVEGVDENLGFIDPDIYARTKATHLLLPRISFSFPVTDRTVFYSQYGKYAQMPSLGQFFRTDYSFSYSINPTTRSVYGGSMPFLVQPEKTTLFEVGFRQFLTDNFAFTMTGFYKDTKNLIQNRRVFNTLGNPIFTAYQNEDFTTMKGVELTLEMRRTNRLSAKLNYTLQDARGTGASSASNSVATSDEIKARFPNFTAPLPYNQTHRGNLVLDYRFGKGDGGPVLEGMGFYLLLTFNSGHNYTKIQEPQNLGQANVWNVGVRQLIDARGRMPVEPANASTTPWVYNLDLNWNKMFYFPGFSFELYVNVLNLLNTKQVIMVYPMTGTPFDDGWLKNPLSDPFKAIPNYEAFYRAINLQNRWGIMAAGWGDVYGAPRQFRVGVRMEL